MCRKFYRMVKLNVKCWTVRYRNHDYGSDMLMHAKHWDGRSTYNYKEEDIANIHKVLTYKCLTPPKVETKWRDKLKLG